MKYFHKYWLPFLLGFFALLGVFLLGLAEGYGRPQVTSTPVSASQVALMVDDGVTIRGYRQEVPAEPTVLGVLKSVTVANNIALEYDPPEKSPYGAFVKKIGNKQNGQDKNYWQYWVNGSQPQISADNYRLSGGEVILWTFRGSAQ